MALNTLAVATEGFAGQPLDTLCVATSGYVCGAVVIQLPAPPPAEQRGGFTRGRTFWDEVDEYQQARIMADDEEILAIMIAATIRILK